MQIQLSNAIVSMRRLTQYFLLEDRKDFVAELDHPGIEIVDGDFFWAEPPPKLVMPEVGRKKKKGKKGSQTADAQKTKENGVVSSSESSPENKAPRSLNDKEEIESGKVTPSSVSSMDTATNAVDAGSLAITLPSMETTTTADEARTKGMAWRLRDVNLTVNAGELVCVVGRVGSGKSSLVQAILGEMEVAGGTVAVGGKVAYAAQQAWIVNASVKDNVAFGLPFEQERWEDAVEACCLSADLEVLPAGADTEIGEKGINLSGGQKQRVSLARALYQNADVYVLDDPLSAVDVHVGRHIFEKFINGAIQDKARLLVTNQLQYLPYADRIVVMDAGSVVAQGTYEECQENESFARLLREHNSQSDAVEDAGQAAKAVTVSKEKVAHSPPRQLNASVSKIEKRELADAVASVPGALGRPGISELKFDRGATFARQPSLASTDDKSKNSAAVYGRKIERFETMRIEHSKADKAAKDDELPKDKSALMIKEDQEVGQVTGKVYWKYIQSYGIFSFVSLIIFWSCEQSVRIITNWYLSQWTGKVAIAQATAIAEQQPYSFNHMPYVGGYVGLAFGFVILTALRSYTNLMSALKASRVIHFKSLSSLVRAPVTFFDTTPVGRILNRFSKVKKSLFSPFFFFLYNINIIYVFIALHVLTITFPSVALCACACRIPMMWTFFCPCP